MTPASPAAALPQAFIRLFGWLGRSRDGLRLPACSPDAPASALADPAWEGGEAQELVRHALLVGECLAKFGTADFLEGQRNNSSRAITTKVRPPWPGPVARRVQGRKCAAVACGMWWRGSGSAAQRPLPVVGRSGCRCARGARGALAQPGWRDAACARAAA
jgi:hypothetical protein